MKYQQRKQRKNQIVSKLHRQILEIAFVMIGIPTLIGTILIFSTNDFSFLDGLYMWDWITK